MHEMETHLPASQESRLDLAKLCDFCCATPTRLQAILPGLCEMETRLQAILPGLCEMETRLRTILPELCEMGTRLRTTLPELCEMETRLQAIQVLDADALPRAVETRPRENSSHQVPRALDFPVEDVPRNSGILRASSP